jgi:hypothetical protein
MKTETLLNARFKLLDEHRAVRQIALKHDITALQQSLDTRHAERLIECAEFVHFDLFVTPDVDTSQHGDIDRHFGCPSIWNYPCSNCRGLSEWCLIRAPPD